MEIGGAISGSDASEVSQSNVHPGTFAQAKSRGCTPNDHKTRHARIWPIPIATFVTVPDYITLHSVCSEPPGRSDSSG